MAGPARYPVPAATRRVEIRVSNSRFIATCMRAATVDDAKAAIQSVRAEFPDATHHVHAYKIGFGASVTEGMSDDGEPSGTSGPPVLAVLRGSGIGDAVVVVTRYFGGTKLGAGGLVSAYGDAAKAVLDGLGTEIKVRRVPVRVEAPYAFVDATRRILAEAEAVVLEEQFAAEALIVGAVPEDAVEAVVSRLVESSAGRARVAVGDAGQA